MNIPKELQKRLDRMKEKNPYADYTHAISFDPLVKRVGYLFSEMNSKMPLSKDLHYIGSIIIPGSGFSMLDEDTNNESELETYVFKETEESRREKNPAFQYYENYLYQNKNNPIPIRLLMKNRVLEAKIINDKVGFWREIINGNDIQNWIVNTNEPNPNLSNVLEIGRLYSKKPLKIQEINTAISSFGNQFLGNKEVKTGLHKNNWIYFLGNEKWSGKDWKEEDKKSFQWKLMKTF